MSTFLTVAIAAVLALNTTTLEPISVVAAPQYDPCGTTQLVKVAAKAQVRHRARRHGLRRAATPAARPLGAHKPHRVTRPRTHKKRPHLVHARQTCDIATGGFGLLDLTGLASGPAAQAPNATPNGVDATATVPGAAVPPSTDQPGFPSTPDFGDGAPFNFGPGGQGGGGGGSGGGGGGGGSGGGSGPGRGGGPTVAPTTPTGPVPEPASWALLLTGFGMLGAALRGRAGLARPPS